MEELGELLFWMIDLDWRIGAVITAVLGVLTAVAFVWGISFENPIFFGTVVELPWWIMMLVRFGPAVGMYYLTLAFFERTRRSYWEKMNPSWRWE